MWHEIFRNWRLNLNTKLNYSIHFNVRNLFKRIFERKSHFLGRFFVKILERTRFGQKHGGGRRLETKSNALADKCLSFKTNSHICIEKNFPSRTEALAALAQSK